MSVDTPRRVNIASPEFKDVPDVPDGFRLAHRAPRATDIAPPAGRGRTPALGRRVPPAWARWRACGAQRLRLDGSRVDVLERQHRRSERYPDSNKIAIWTGNADDDIIVKRTSGVGYWDGEPTWIVRALGCRRPRMAGRREAPQLLNFPALAATSRHGMAATFDPKVGGSIPSRRVGPASGSAATRSSPWASAGASARSPNG
jgi:hypothetical protein